MKYFVLLLQEFEDGTTKKSVYEFDSKKDAIANFHKSLGSAMSNNTVVHTLCQVTDKYGTICANEYQPETEPISYVAPVIETPVMEPEPVVEMPVVEEETTPIEE